MLARLDQAILNYRYTETPLARHARDEAIAFLEWLRDDNFTFLGMREYRYRGTEKTGTLDRTDEAGLGILSDPSVRVLRVGSEAVTTTPEIRTFLHGPDALIVTKANTKSVVHRRAYLDYVGVKTFDTKGRLVGELRIVGLFTSSAYTRSVMDDPVHPLEGGKRHREIRLRPGRPFRQGTHQRAGVLSARRALPDLGAPAAQVRRGDPGARRAPSRPRARPCGPLRPLRLRSRLCSARSLRQPCPRTDRRLSEDRLRRAPVGLLSELSRGRAGARPLHHRPLRRQDAEGRIARTRGRRPRHRPDLGGHARSDRGRSRHRPALRRNRCGFPEGYRRSFTAADALGDATRVAAVSPDNPIIVDFRRRSGQPETAAS